MHRGDTHSAGRTFARPHTSINKWLVWALIRWRAAWSGHVRRESLWLCERKMKTLTGFISSRFIFLIDKLSVFGGKKKSESFSSKHCSRVASSQTRLNGFIIRNVSWDQWRFQGFQRNQMWPIYKKMWQKRFTVDFVFHTLVWFCSRFSYCISNST